jgi:hypothetical protein
MTSKGDSVKKTIGIVCAALVGGYLALAVGMSASAAMTYNLHAISCGSGTTVSVNSTANGSVTHKVTALNGSSTKWVGSSVVTVPWHSNHWPIASSTGGSVSSTDTVSSATRYCQ